MLDIVEEGFQSELQYSSILIQSGSYVKHLSHTKNCAKNQELVLKDFDLVLRANDILRETSLILNK